MRLLEFFRPYRVIVTRRVTEEEQVSVEAFHKDVARCEADLQRFLGVFREHRKATNQEVVRVTQQQLTALDTAINAKGDEARRLDGEIEEKRIKAQRLDSLIRDRRKRSGLTSVE